MSLSHGEAAENADGEEEDGTAHAEEGEVVLKNSDLLIDKNDIKMLSECLTLVGKPGNR